MFEPINQTDLSKELLRQLEQKVQEGKLKKGDKLPSEREWAASLKISRATLKEAIRALELIGIIESSQGDDNYLSNNIENTFLDALSIIFQLEGGTLQQIHSFRKAMEIAAIQEAAERITPQQVKMLSAICDKLEQGNIAFHEFFSSLDQRFHMIIIQISSNPLIKTMMKAAEHLIQNQIRSAREKMENEVLAHEKINSQHRDIVNALRNGDGQEAARAMQRHMDYTSTFYE